MQAMLRNSPHYTAAPPQPHHSQNRTHTGSRHTATAGENTTDALVESTDGARTPTSPSAVDGTSFCDMLYLGSVSVSGPCNRGEILSYLHRCDTAQARSASIFVPFTSHDCVRIVAHESAVDAAAASAAALDDLPASASSSSCLLLEEHSIRSIAYCCLGQDQWSQRFAFTVGEAATAAGQERQASPPLHRVVMLSGPSEATARAVVSQMAQAFR